MPTGSVCPDLMDREQLMHWILRRLGAPRWNIELHPCQLEDAIEDAMQWYLKWKGVRKKASITMLSGVVEYDWPEDADYILDVVPPGNDNDLFLGVAQIGFTGQGYYGNLMPYSHYRESYAAGGPYSSIAQSIQYTDSARRVISREWNWWTERHDRKLYISPVPHSTGEMAVFYKSGCINLSELSAYDHELVKRYALATATYTLGLIRRKFTTVETAGSTKNLDGEQLVQEAREDMERLDEEIRKSCYPMPMTTG